MKLEILSHARNVVSSGYTIIPDQISKTQLLCLRQAADRAIAAALEALANDREFAHTYASPARPAMRCLYCWGDACVDLLEHPTIHALAEELLGDFRLWDMPLLTNTPLMSDMEFHRDFGEPF